MQHWVSNLLPLNDLNSHKTIGAVPFSLEIHNPQTDQMGVHALRGGLSLGAQGRVKIDDFHKGYIAVYLVFMA